MAPDLITPRLRLRQWLDADRGSFAAMNADPEVMRYFPATLSRAQSDAMVDRMQAALEADDFGLWAVEAESGFIGMVGLSVPGYPTPASPCVEIGWRLARHAWGHGYATEAAHAALAHGFEGAGLEEIVSFTATQNQPSRALMERLRMSRDPADDFDHPKLAGHPLARHVLYRLTRASWARSRP